MRVRVVLPEHKRSSYNGKRVVNGDLIDINPWHFSENWMVKVKKPKNKRKQP